MDKLLPPRSFPGQDHWVIHAGWERQSLIDSVAAELRRCHGEEISLQRAPGVGLSALEPLVSFRGRLFYTRLSTEAVQLHHTSRGLELVEFPGGWDHPFFSGQTPLLTASLRSSRLNLQGHFDKESLHRAMENGACSLLPGLIQECSLPRGRSAAVRNLMENLQEAGIRGRGGSGYPAHRKWEQFFAFSGEKLIVCNGDEGNPGAYMDRILLEGDPWSVMEPMIAAGILSGAAFGVIYLRSEYVHLYTMLQQAVSLLEAETLCGDKILGSGISFSLYPVLGAGAYICGEESALLRSLEGEIPEPAKRPPYPASSGYRGGPSLVHNVETWASITAALRIGAEQYAALGHSGHSGYSDNSDNGNNGNHKDKDKDNDSRRCSSGGTKLLSFSGQIPVPALVEVPFGTPLSRVLDLLAALPGSESSACPDFLQIGGPSGGFLPASRYHLPLDYQDLEEANTPLGSGGIIALNAIPNQNRHPDLGAADPRLPLIRSMLAFSAAESCGKCTPCREGLPLLLTALDQMFPFLGQSGGNAPAEGAPAALFDMALRIRDASFCGLGSGAVRPLISWLSESTSSMQEESSIDNTYSCAPAEASMSIRNFLSSRGIILPSLCSYPGLSTEGNCRCCLVESEGEIISSCDHLISDLTRINTGDIQDALSFAFHLNPASPRAIRARRFSLLLSWRHRPDHPGLLRQMEIDGLDPGSPDSLYPAEKLLVTLHNGSNATGGAAAGKSLAICILCGRCLAACGEVSRQHVLTSLYRGADRRIASPMGPAADACIGCGACQMVCPVDAIALSYCSDNR